MRFLSCLPLFLAGCMPPPSVVNAVPAPPMLTIDATATLYLAPDTAAVSLTFSDIGDAMGPAHHRVEAARAAFLARVAPLDVRVETGAFAYAPIHERDAVRERYRASQTLVVHTTQLASIPEIIDASGERLSAVSVRHYVADMVQHRARIRAMAIEAAGTKAAALAEGFDVALGAPLLIEERGASASSWSVGNTSNVMASVSSESDQPAPPGAIPLEITLRISYALQS